jgi:predicted ATP-grasp superfamily ATP-dependent carboligase
MRHVVLGGSANALAICRQLDSPGTVLVDVQERAPAHRTRYTESVILTSDAAEDILRTLLDLPSEQPRILYPTSDFWLEFISQHAQTLRENGFLFFQKSCDCAEILLDKLKFFEVMNRRFQVPHTEAAEGFAESATEIVKPRRAFIGGKLSQKGFRSNAPGLSSTHIRQQRLNSDLHNHLSISGLFLDGSLTASICTRKVLEYPHPGGTAVMVSTIDSKELIARLEVLAQQALRHLDYEGIFELEAILQEGELWLLEINGRFWLQHAMGSNRKVNFSRAYAEALLGNVPASSTLNADKVVWIHEGMPVAFLKASRASRIDAIKTMFSKGQWIFAHFNRKDYMPFIEFIKCKLAN